MPDEQGADHEALLDESHDRWLQQRAAADALEAAVRSGERSRVYGAMLVCANYHVEPAQLAVAISDGITSRDVFARAEAAVARLTEHEADAIGPIISAAKLHADLGGVVDADIVDDAGDEEPPW